MKNIVDIIFEIIIWVGMAIIVFAGICVLIKRAVEKRNRININNMNRKNNPGKDFPSGETASWDHGYYEGLIEEEERDLKEG